MPDTPDILRSLVNRLGFLEDEHQQTRLISQKLQQQVDTILNSHRDHALRQEAFEQAFNASRAQVARVPALEEEVRQLREKYLSLQQEVASGVQAQDKLYRLHEMENERLRVADAENANRVELLVDEINQLHSRLGPVGDIMRRYGEGLAKLTQEAEAVAGKTEALSARHSVTGEQLRRLEQEFSRLENELDPLRAQDTVALNRVQITLDQVKRLDEQVQHVNAAVTLVQELSERVQIYRIEHQRLEDDLASLRSVLEELSQRTEEHARLLRTADERRSAQQEQILKLQQQLAETRNDVGERIVETHQLLTQARLRDLAEVERQVRDMKEHETRLKGRLG